MRVLGGFGGLLSIFQKLKIHLLFIMEKKRAEELDLFARISIQDVDVLYFLQVRLVSLIFFFTCRITTKTFLLGGDGMNIATRNCDTFKIENIIITVPCTYWELSISHHWSCNQSFNFNLLGRISCAALARVRSVEASNGNNTIEWYLNDILMRLIE